MIDIKIYIHIKSIGHCINMQGVVACCVDDSMAANESKDCCFLTQKHQLIMLISRVTEN